MGLPGCTLSLPASIQAEIAELVRSAARYGFGLLRDNLRLFIADFVTITGMKVANWYNI